MSENKPSVSMVIPQSVFDSFRRNPGQRWGQSFYGHMKLHKCVQDRDFCDKLYNERDDQVAKAMVRARLDPHS